jgi:hypothetical protein
MRGARLFRVTAYSDVVVARATAAELRGHSRAEQLRAKKAKELSHL